MNVNPVVLIPLVILGFGTILYLIISSNRADGPSLKGLVFEAGWECGRRLPNATLDECKAKFPVTLK